MTELTPAANDQLNALGQDLVKNFAGNLDFKRMGEVTGLKDTINNKMDPVSREALIQAANKDPAGFTAAAKQKIIQNPALLDQVSSDPNALTKIMGVSPSAPQAAAAAPSTPAAPQPAAPNHHAAEAPQATAPAATAPSAATASAAAPTDMLGTIAASLSADQKPAFARFVTQMAKNPDLSDAMQQLDTGTDPAKKNTFVQAIKDAAKKDPKFFDKMNDMVSQHPQMVANMASRFVDDPKGTLDMVNQYQKIDGFRGQLVSWLSGISPMLGQFVNKLFNGLVNSPFAAGLMGMAAPYMSKMEGLMGSGSVTSVNNGQTLVPPGGPKVTDAKSGQDITPAATPAAPAQQQQRPAVAAAGPGMGGSPS